MASWAGDLIRVAREETGISQRELAKRAGTSQAAISAYEAGKKSPTLETLARIIRATGMDLAIRLEPASDHDIWVEAYEASLPEPVRKKAVSDRLEMINQARADRGLPPVTDKDLVRG